MNDNTMGVLIVATIVIGIVAFTGTVTNYKSKLKFAEQGYVQEVVPGGSMVCDRVIWVKGK